MLLFSCSKDDGDVSTITSPQEFDFTSITEPITVPEEAGTYDINFTFDQNQIIDVNIEISESSNSTATEGVDYDLSTHDVDVSTLAGEGSFSVTVYEDFLPEETESVVVNIGGGDPFRLPASREVTLLNIENKVYPPAIQLDWSTDFAFGTSTFNTCGNSDIDLLVYDDMGNEVSGFAAATGACPEILFGDAITVDGTYDLVAQLFDNNTIGPLVGSGVDSFAYNMEVVLFKGGVVAPEGSTARYNTLEFDNADKFFSYSPSDAAGDNLITIGSITKSGSELVLFDPNGAEVGRFD